MKELGLSCIFALIGVLLIEFADSVYTNGYKAGQIDALSSNIHYQLTTNQTMEVVWTKIERNQNK
jgi:hypothetical protein